LCSDDPEVRVRIADINTEKHGWKALEAEGCRTHA
jgi:hypothetical protein